MLPKREIATWTSKKTPLFEFSLIWYLKSVNYFGQTTSKVRIDRYTSYNLIITSYYLTASYYLLLYLYAPYYYPYYWKRWSIGKASLYLFIQGRSPFEKHHPFSTWSANFWCFLYFPLRETHEEYHEKSRGNITVKKHCGRHLCTAVSRNLVSCVVHNRPRSSTEAQGSELPRDMPRHREYWGGYSRIIWLQSYNGLCR